MNVSSKPQMRAQLRRIRDDIPADKRPLYDNIIQKKLLSLHEVIQANAIFCFISFDNEVDTHELIKKLQQQGKDIVVPKLLQTGRMAPIALESWQDLEADSFGILVPRSSKPFNSGIDLCLTPGLGFSPSGQRLGYGCGYYDRWFAENQVKQKIGIAYECQILDEIPTDESDVPLDKVVTEKRIYIVKKV